jgi:hypothetical protein
MPSSMNPVNRKSSFRITANWKWTTVIVLILLIGLYSCTKEQFDTSLKIKFTSNIQNLQVLPTPVEIRRYTLDNNIIVRDVLEMTIYTDSFGKFDEVIKLPKLSSHEYYQAFLRENKWVLPIVKSQPVKAGIANNIEFSIVPKWYRTLILVDSSGKFDLWECTVLNSKSQEYTDRYKMNTFPQSDTLSLVTSAPSFSHIFVELAMYSKDSSKFSRVNYVFNSEDSFDLWVKF